MLLVGQNQNVAVLPRRSSLFDPSEAENEPLRNSMVEQQHRVLTEEDRKQPEE